MKSPFEGSVSALLGAFVSFGMKAVVGRYRNNRPLSGSSQRPVNVRYEPNPAGARMSDMGAKQTIKRVVRKYGLLEDQVRCLYGNYPKFAVGTRNKGGAFLTRKITFFLARAMLVSARAAFLAI